MLHSNNKQVHIHSLRLQCLHAEHQLLSGSLPLFHPSRPADHSVRRKWSATDRRATACPIYLFCALLPDGYGRVPLPWSSPDAAAVRCPAVLCMSISNEIIRLPSRRYPKSVFWAGCVRAGPRACPTSITRGSGGIRSGKGNCYVNLRKLASKAPCPQTFCKVSQASEKRKL